MEVGVYFMIAIVCRVFIAITPTYNPHDLDQAGLFFSSIVRLDVLIDPFWLFFARPGRLIFNSLSILISSRALFVCFGRGTRAHKKKTTRKRPNDHSVLRCQEHFFKSHDRTERS